jgi:hypothetical protein
LFPVCEQDQIEGDPVRHLLFAQILKPITVSSSGGYYDLFLLAIRQRILFRKQDCYCLTGKT